MSKTSTLPIRTILFSAGIVAAFFIGIFFAALFFVSHPEERSISYYEILSLIVNVLIATATIAAIAFTYVSFQAQKKQWLAESFIRRESEVLLDLRDKLAKSSGAISFFFNDLLLLEHKYDPAPNSPPIITQSNLAKNFNTLFDLNELYNLHQHIFRKH